MHTLPFHENCFITNRTLKSDIDEQTQLTNSPKEGTIFFKTPELRKKKAHVMHRNMTKISYVYLEQLITMLLLPNETCFYSVNTQHFLVVKLATRLSPLSWPSSDHTTTQEQKLLTTAKY